MFEENVFLRMKKTQRDMIVEIIPMLSAWNDYQSVEMNDNFIVHFEQIEIED